jgi:hypothetical protein
VVSTWFQSGFKRLQRGSSCFKVVSNWFQRGSSGFKLVSKWFQSGFKGFKGDSRDSKGFRGVSKGFQRGYMWTQKQFFLKPRLFRISR